jgi:hypothetical protein
MSRDQLAKYYFGLDFWYILGGRLVLLSWWLVSGAKSADGAGRLSVAGDQGQSEPGADESALGRLLATAKRLNRALPINRATLIKCLIVLVYAQMLIKEMENERNLAGETSLLSADDHEAPIGVGHQHSPGCCSSSASATANQDEQRGTGLLEASTSWFQCMWNSAQACTRSVGDAGSQSSRASRLLDAILGVARQVLGALLTVFAYVYNRTVNAPTSIQYIYTLWLVRWRSSVVQRLMQSVFIQIYYICSILFADDDENSDRDDFL